jgi:diguanylate cyclase (GGDEF)-like protein
MQMLADGKIDLMSDVSYTDKRAKAMLFSSLPMGAEEYYIFISPNNKVIDKDDISTFNGKKVGVNKGSVQAGFFREWAEANGVRAELVEMTEDVDESLDMLNRGDIDMYVVLDGYLDARLAVPVRKVGASDFFFAVNASRPDLLTELNTAMNRIQEEDHSYHQQLYDKYLKAFGFNYYLSTEEKSWLSGHGPIRVGYQDNCLSFCAADKKTGELTGALKDYLEEASVCFENADLDFEPKAYPSAAAAFEALGNGEVDCVFPSNLSAADGEGLDLVMTPSIMTSEIYAIVHKDDQHTLFQKEQVEDLSKRVFVDALTSVRNKGGFNECIQSLQERLDNEEQLAFAVIILDCDNLKAINDQYGHERGDAYIKTASGLICRIFKHSPVFRIGGDEFAVVLQNEDYQNRRELLELFEKNMNEIQASAGNEWEQISVSLGMAEYDPQSDASVDDVVRHADKAMYENKRERKGLDSVR